MVQVRKRLQGVVNIITFNWHFYAIAFFVLCLFIFIHQQLPYSLQAYNLLGCVLLFTTTILSLLVSYYVYDASDLYKLNWLPDDKQALQIVNISAGFDETSALLQAKYANATLTVMDFYNPTTHTEVSIRRARKAYPAYPNTQTISTTAIPLPNNFADKIFVILAAHEIRNDAERRIFFKELGRILKPNGQIIVTEHLRDIANALAYNIGFLHFLSKKNWYTTFSHAVLHIKSEHKITPFITTFILNKHGDTA
jgi:ubiquinone/menaquinone biosynthesis C-methylase UbiE